MNKINLEKLFLCLKKRAVISTVISENFLMFAFYRLICFANFCSNAFLHKFFFFFRINTHLQSCLKILKIYYRVTFIFPEEFSVNHFTVN